TEESVSCVVLDALTGDVLALVSSPSYDPMLFSAGLTPAMWQELSTDPRNPLSNKAIAGVYPPGSTFKPVVALAALEAGNITPDTAVTCPGSLGLGDATFPCWRQGGDTAADRDDGGPPRHRPPSRAAPDPPRWIAAGGRRPRPGRICAAADHTARPQPGGRRDERRRQRTGRHRLCGAHQGARAGDG